MHQSSHPEVPACHLRLQRQFLFSEAQLANKARKAGDTPDIVRDSITKVTLFDYSDIIAGEDDEEEDNE